MAKSKAETILERVKHSGLVEKSRLKTLVADLKREAGGQPVADVADVIIDRLIATKLITRWQADRLNEGRYKGFFLGKYKLLDHLGTGGMSRVYLAEHVVMHRRVAIKVLPKHRVADTSYLARFHLEAQAAASLDHRNIVRAYDVDNDGDLHYIVMEYVDGRDLQHVVKEDGPLGYVVAADYIRQAAEGLAHAHESGLIHRDVKPANLLIDRKNVIKLLDLGLARFTDAEKASLTVEHDENVLGTADYLAPEQALNSHGADARSDIYGLGGSLYFLLTGHPPFVGGTLMQRLVMHQKKPPPDILSDRPDAPADLVAICLKMIAKKPDDRYQTAAEVAAALTAWLVTHGQTVSDGSSGISSRKLLPAEAASLPEENLQQPQKPVPHHRTTPPSLPQRPSETASPAEPAGSNDLGTANEPRPTIGRPENGPDKLTDRFVVKANINNSSKATGGSSSLHIGGASDAGSRITGKKRLPVAQPLQEEKEKSPSAAAPDSDDLDVSIALWKDYGALKEGELDAYLKHQKGLPTWLVLCTAGAAVVLLILAVVVLVMNR